jgi:hypothetical protein
LVTERESKATCLDSPELFGVGVLIGGCSGLSKLMMATLSVVSVEESGNVARYVGSEPTVQCHKCEVRVRLEEMLCGSTSRRPAALCPNCNQTLRVLVKGEGDAEWVWVNNPEIGMVRW